MVKNEARRTQAMYFGVIDHRRAAPLIAGLLEHRTGGPVYLSFHRSGDPTANSL